VSGSGTGMNARKVATNCRYIDNIRVNFVAAIVNVSLFLPYDRIIEHIAAVFFPKSGHGAGGGFHQMC